MVKRTLMIRRFGLLFVVGAVLWIAGCGSSSNPTTVTGVTVTCLPSAIQSSQLIQCSATVIWDRHFSTTVNWWQRQVLSLRRESSRRPSFRRLQRQP